MLIQRGARARGRIEPFHIAVRDGGRRDRLHGRIDTMYLDRLDGRISAEFFDEKSKAWREEQKQSDARLAQLATTGLRSAAEVVQMMKSVSDGCACFTEAEPPQKRRAGRRSDAELQVEGRNVREFLENAVRQNGTFELRKPNERKVEKRFRAKF
jgi:hypothetical protein